MCADIFVSGTRAERLSASNGGRRRQVQRSTGRAESVPSLTLPTEGGDAPGRTVRA
jgi:hypothetical protein